VVLGFGIIVLAALLLNAGIKGRTLGEVLRGEIGRGFAFADIKLPTIATLAAGTSGTGGTGGTDSGDGLGGIEGGGGVGTAKFDGKVVAAVAIPYLEFARAHGWNGTVTSGYRTPEYSEALCRQMCGAPSCPGRCAGRSSNHSGLTSTRFAIDVSAGSETTFGQLMARPDAPRPRIFNNLPSDRIHFSPTGG
jgi:hypothetical protein